MGNLERRNRENVEVVEVCFLLSPAIWLRPARNEGRNSPIEESLAILVSLADYPKKSSMGMLRDNLSLRERGREPSSIRGL